jgi:hypothetical protein
VRAPGAAAVGAGRRRGRREGAGAAVPAPEDVPELPRPPARVPRGAGSSGPRWCRRRWWPATAAVLVAWRNRHWGVAAEGRGAPRRRPAQGSGARRARPDGRELVAGQKVAALAASAAALAGGGTAWTSWLSTRARPSLRRRLSRRRRRGSRTRARRRPHRRRSTRRRPRSSPLHPRLRRSLLRRLRRPTRPTSSA